MTKAAGPSGGSSACGVSAPATRLATDLENHLTVCRYCLKRNKDGPFRWLTVNRDSTIGKPSFFH